jgi:hypothetical protein
MPWCKGFSFTEPFSCRSAFRSVEVELFPTAKGKFCAELTQVCMNTLWVHGAHEGLPRVYIGVVKPCRAAIGFLTRANQPAMRGMDVLPGSVTHLSRLPKSELLRTRESGILVRCAEFA